ncbi:hypothetical protein [uncultured Sphingomonas sp.]|uniref:hypothetical protein n=1 Tax=uncultured Sphingomonas sp. TaxID=158754 RepID=UPI0035C9F8C0
MTFWRALTATYGGSLAFLVACPLLALVPVVFELLQHGIEVHIGMYDSLEAAQATEHHPLRMGFGMLKVASLVVPGYWIVRYLARRDPVFAARVEPTAVRLFAGFLIFELALAAIQLFLLPPSATVLLVSFIVGQIIGCLVAAWAVAAPLGDAAIGPRASAAIMVRQLPWTLAFLLAAMLPLMIPHYALGALAIVGPKPLLWPVLIADSLLVGWLAAVIIASIYFAAVRAAGKAGVAIAPSAHVTATPNDEPLAA